MSIGGLPPVNTTVLVIAAGVTSAIAISNANQVSVGCSSNAGASLIVEGSFDGDTWNALHFRTTVVTLLLTAPGALIGAIEEDVPLIRFDVNSLTASTTLTLSVYGVGV